MPITIPQGVDIKIDKDNLVTIKGPKGTLVRNMHSDMIIKVDKGVMTVEIPSESKLHKSLFGLTRTLLNNMVVGVTKGFEKVLEINGVGYRAAKSGKKLVLTLGYSHPVEVEEGEGITFDVPTPNKIIVKGIDKQLIGEYAAKIRGKRLPEPYKGKGIKYENEVIKRKEGKTGKKK
jgi:large subunit ribosomal protein L6